MRLTSPSTIPTQELCKANTLKLVYIWIRPCVVCALRHVRSIGCALINCARKPYILRSRSTHLRFLSTGMPTYDKVAVEQVFPITFWTRHRTSAHRFGDEVEGVGVDEAVVEAEVVDEAEDAPVAATHNNPRRRLRGSKLVGGHALQTVSDWPGRGRSSPPLPGTENALLTARGRPERERSSPPLPRTGNAPLTASEWPHVHGPG